MKLSNRFVVLQLISTCGLFLSVTCLPSMAQEKLVVDKELQAEMEETFAQIEQQKNSVVNDRWVRFLFIKSIREELELTEEQIKNIDEAKAELDKNVAEIQDQQNQIRRAVDPKLTEGEREKREQLQDEQMFKLDKARVQAIDKFKQQINEILVPSQVARIKQIHVLDAVRNQQDRYPNIFLTPYMIAELKIGDAQQAEMAKLMRESKQQLDEFTAKHQKATQEKMEALLNKEQKEKVKELLGEEFKFDR
jgi:hypothetical protein